MSRLYQFTALVLACVIVSSGADVSSTENDIKKDDVLQEDQQQQNSVNEATFIQGPKSLNDKIAIVGAGPSGIHMAVLLQDKGFKNIEILEKEDRIGGKAKTIFRNDTPQELGACCMGPGYENNVIALIKRFAPGDLVPRGMPSVWVDDLPIPITYGQYIIRESMKHFKTKNATLATLKLVQVMKRYVALHRSMFGVYQFELMPRPSAAVLSKCSGSFLDFLKRNDMESLVSLFIVAHTGQGYDYLDEIGAVYGLMWNPPSLINGLLAILGGDQTPRTFLTKNGFQSFWETVARKANLNLHLGVKIRSVIRRRKFVTLCSQNWDCEKFDFVIWSPELKSSLSSFRPKFADEKKLFSSMTSRYLIASSVDVVGGIHTSFPTEYWLDNLTFKRDQTVYAVRDSYGALTRQGYAAIQSTKVVKVKDKRLRSVVTYQYSRLKPCRKQTRQLLIQHFKDRMGKKVKINQHSIWKYFPRFSFKETQKGRLWDILDIQGKHKMWYIGSSVSFESMKSVIEYNKLLISKMRPLQG